MLRNFLKLLLLLLELLEDDCEDFESLDNIEKSSYVLGSELCACLVWFEVRHSQDREG